MKKLFIISMATVAIAANSFANFKIAAIPDTQRMTEYSAASFDAEIKWIADNASSEGIEFLTHLGDVVDDDHSAQWSTAANAMAQIDGVIPYSVCIGNHDYTSRSNRLEGVADFVGHFGPSHYDNYTNSWFKGSYRDVNFYQIFSAEGRDWLHLNLEYMPDSEELLWAQRVIDAHPSLPVIFSTHSFLKENGILSSDPNKDQMGESSNGGESQWYQFVRNNDQIFLVLNGHHFVGSDGVAHTNIVNAYGHDVFIQCINYQSVEDYDAHFRLIEFDFTNNKLNMTTYEPDHDTGLSFPDPSHVNANYLTDAENQFSVNIDFSTRFSSFSARETFSTIQAANLTVVENNLNNSNNSVTVSIPAGQSTANMSVVPVGTTDYTDHSNGDYYLQFGNNINDDRLGGIMLASVAQNGRVSMDGTNYYHIAQAPAGGHGQYYVATATTANGDEYPGYYGGQERDVNVAVAYFPFEQGWTAGRVETYNNGTTNWCMVGSENIKLGVNLTQLPQGDISSNLLQKVGGSTAPYWSNPEADRGIWNLEIPGVNSIFDGILLVCGGKNEDNYAAASPWRDGSGWQISVHDSGGGDTESDPWNFVYVPYSTENIVAGRGNAKAGSVSGTGGFTLTTNGTGGVILDIAGYTPADGTLIVSTENEWYNSDDFTTYEPTPTNWIIETRDLTGATLVSASSTQFAFLFIPFTNAPAGPGTRPSYGFDYGDSVHWIGTGDWMTDTNNWSETPGNGSDWGIPGWVVGNPLNTGGSTDPNWNGGNATIDSGTLNLTPTSKPDGTLGTTHVGTDRGNATLNISGDATIRGTLYQGYHSKAGMTGTVNQVSGNVITIGNTRQGNDKGYSIYNLSGGTLSMQGGYDSLGYGAGSAFEFNQTGGTLTDTGTRLNIGFAANSTSVVNLSGGVFDTSATTIYVGGSGHGTFNQSGGSALTKYISLAAGAGSSGTYSISGGSLSVSGYFTGPTENGVFEVNGSGATNIDIRAMYLANGDTFRVKLDENGSTLVNITRTDSDNSVQLNNGSHFEVDTLPSFNGTGGQVYDIIYSEGGFMTDGMVFTNLSTTAEFTWAVVPFGNGEMLQLTVKSATTAFEQWAGDYGLTGDDAATTNDYDADGLNNLYEYALGGDPTNAADQGISPVHGLVADVAGDWMRYVYPKLSDPNSGVTYHIEVNDDLLYGNWTNANYTVTGTGTIDAEFDSVTNKIPTTGKPAQFIRLIVEEQ